MYAFARWSERVSNVRYALACRVIPNINDHCLRTFKESEFVFGITRQAKAYRTSLWFGVQKLTPKAANTARTTARIASPQISPDASGIRISSSDFGEVLAQMS